MSDSLFGAPKPVATFGNPRKIQARRKPTLRDSRASQLRKLDDAIERLIRTADSRGYSSMVGSKGSLFDDPAIKKLMRRRDELLSYKG